MYVDSVETIPVPIPRQKSYRTSLHDGTDAYDHLLVVIRTQTGTVGVGEIAPAPYWPQGMTRDACHVILEDELVSAVEGQSLVRIPRLVEELDRRVSDLPFVRYGIDVALFDALGKAWNRPVYDLLGGPTDADRVVPIHQSLGLQEADEMVAAAERAVDTGIHDLKIKVGSNDPVAEREGIEAVASTVPGTCIRIDANQAWMADEAIRRIRALDAASDGLKFVEQPVAHDDLDGLTHVRAAVEPPVLVDESCFSPRDVVDIARRDAADAVNIKLGKTGGLVGARRVATVAQSHGLSCFVGSMEELGVGAAASLHFALATPTVTYPTGVHNTYPTDELLQNVDDWTATNGQIVVPDTPGLGIELDREVIERYRVD